jgi:2-haloacid dehalogenase
MSVDRREFIRLTASGIVTSASLANIEALVRTSGTRYRAVAFDAFPIFDPRPIFAMAETLFPGKGTALSNAWRTRQFEYQWLRATGRQYADFRQTTEDALVFAAKSLELDLTPDRKAQLMDGYARISVWPDVQSSLQRLKDAGLRLAVLSNMTASMLETGIRNAKLDRMFDHVLSTDKIRTYKPDPRAYRLGIDAFKLKREEIVFAAFAGWDAAGAKWFGYPTVWVNRGNSRPEELGATPDAVGTDLSTLTTFVNASP